MSRQSGWRFLPFPSNPPKHRGETQRTLHLLHISIRRQMEREWPRPSNAVPPRKTANVGEINVGDVGSGVMGSRFCSLLRSAAGPLSYSPSHPSFQRRRAASSSSREDSSTAASLVKSCDLA